MSLAGKPGFRLPKNQRLVRATEFKSTTANNCKSKDALFVVYAKDNNRLFSRLGVTVSRRVAVKAVERNRIKRVIRESFRHQQGILSGFDVVVIARAVTRQVETKQLFVSLEKHWCKVDQQCKHATL